MAGRGVLALLDEIEKEAGVETTVPQVAQLARALCGAVASARLAVLHLVSLGENNKLREASAVSVPYLMMLGWLCGALGCFEIRRGGRIASG